MIKRYSFIRSRKDLIREGTSSSAVAAGTSEKAMEIKKVKFASTTQPRYIEKLPSEEEEEVGPLARLVARGYYIV